VKYISSKHHHFVDYFALVNAGVSAVTLAPQAIKIGLASDVGSVSISTFLLILTNSVVWIAYSRHRGLFPLFISSSFNAFFAVVIIFGAFLK